MITVPKVQPHMMWFGITTMFALIMVTLLAVRPNTGTTVYGGLVGGGMPANSEPISPEERKKAHDLAYASWAMGILSTMSFVAGLAYYFRSSSSSSSIKQ